MLTTDVATGGSGDAGSVALIGTDVVAMGGLLSNSREGGKVARVVCRRSRLEASYDRYGAPLIWLKHSLDAG